MSHHTPTAQGDLLSLVVDTHRADELEQPSIFEAIEPEPATPATPATPAHLLPAACYVCGGTEHPDTTARGGHHYWANDDAAAYFRAESARLSRPGHAEAAYVAEHRPY